LRQRIRTEAGWLCAQRWALIADAVVPEKQTVKMLSCSSLNKIMARNNAGSRFLDRVTDHQSRAGTSQDATKAAIRRIAMGSARSGA
jgi:hypothetical protein